MPECSTCNGVGALYTDCAMRACVCVPGVQTSKPRITKSGKLHGSIRCVECGGKHDGANLVKIDLDGKPRHGLCRAPFRPARSLWSDKTGGCW